MYGEFFVVAVTVTTKSVYLEKPGKNGIACYPLIFNASSVTQFREIEKAYCGGIKVFYFLSFSRL